MATPYTVNLADGGQIVVNANSPQAALENAGAPAGATVSAGSYTGGSGQSSSTPSAPGQTTSSAVSPVNGTVTAPGAGTITGASGAAIDAYLQALATGNQAAAQEAIRQFNAGFGLDVNKFNEAIREYNQAFNISEAGLTGTYNGQPTLAAQQQAFTQALSAAGVTGIYQGQPTLAAQQQAFSQGLSALTEAVNVQANPFKQAQVLSGEGALGFTPAMAAAAGVGSPLASFQAPSGSAADTATLGWLASQTGAPQTAAAGQPQAGTVPPVPGMGGGQPGTTGAGTGSALQNSIDYLHGLNPTLKDPAYQQVLLNSRGWVYWPGENLDPNTHLPTTGSYPGIQATFQAPTVAAAPAAPVAQAATPTPATAAAGTTSYVQDQANHWLNTLPAPNQINWTAVQSGGPGVTNLVTQAAAQKWGLDPADIQSIAKATMPQFSAPTLSGAFKG